MEIQVVELNTIAYDDSLEWNKHDLALVMNSKEVEELAEQLKKTEGGKFYRALEKWLDRPYRNKGKED